MAPSSHHQSFSRALDTEAVLSLCCLAGYQCRRHACMAHEPSQQPAHLTCPRHAATPHPRLPMWATPLPSS